MNSIEPVADPKRGILLTDTVNMDWLRSVRPRYYEDYIKFVVDFETGDVYVGMDFHADCVPGNIPSNEKDRRFRGGNIFFADGTILYESTLNIRGNITLGGTYEDIRHVTDEATIARVNDVLYKYARSYVEKWLLVLA